MAVLNPTLPQHDGRASRARELAKERETYRYSYDWPPEVAVAAEVPKGDSYSPQYIARMLPLSKELFLNTLALGPAIDRKLVEEMMDKELNAALDMSGAALGHWFFDVQTRLSEHITSASAPSASHYEELFAHIPKEPLVACFDEDRAFAWQRVAGVNPMWMRRVSNLPDHIAIGEETWTAVIGVGSMADAAAQGRLFVCDYTLLAGASGGVTEGRQKYLPAPYAVFASVDGQLRPVAIQAGPKDGDPVYTPKDGHAWRLAKLAMQVAEASIHETTVHLGRTHMVMEAVALATRRQLSSHHPLRVLIEPHIAFTLPINHSAATSLIAPGGTIDRAFGAVIEDSAGLVRVALDTWKIDEVDLPSELAARGVDDPATLPEYPYRDDGLLVWRAIENFVRSYVRHYYPTDAEVLGDTELAAWTAELGAEDGARLRGVSAITSVEQLVKRVTTFLWTGSAQHSAVNFTQFPFMGVVANMAGALWDAWPVPEGEEADAYVRLLPPANMAVLQFNTVYQLSNVRVNWLGKYPPTDFAVPTVRRMVKAFQNELEEVEAVIRARNPGRYLPYLHLLPSTIPASIHI